MATSFLESLEFRLRGKSSEIARDIHCAEPTSWIDGSSANDHGIRSALHVDLPSALSKLTDDGGNNDALSVELKEQ